MKELYIQTETGQMKKLSDSEVFYRDESGQMKREQRVENIADWYSNQKLYEMHMDCQTQTRQALHDIAIKYQKTLADVNLSLQNLTNRINQHNHFNERINENAKDIEEIQTSLTKVVSVAKGRKEQVDSSYRLMLFIFSTISVFSVILGILNYFK